MLQEIEKLTNTLNQLDTDNWIQNDLFSYQWWIILIANGIFFAVFLVLMDRKRIFQIVIGFMICFVIVCSFDDIGEYYRWWSYPHQLIPFLTEVDTVDFAVVPVTITLIYQFFKFWKNYLLVQIGTSLVYAFVGLPLFVYLGEIKLLNWKYFYSFLVLILTGLLLKVITDFITRKDQHLKEHKQDYVRQFKFSALRSKRKAR